MAQWDLHRFFLPTVTLEESELASYRIYITKLERSLPHKAGKQFKALCGAHIQKAAAAQGSSQVQVRPIMKPEPDFQKLARALMMLARAATRSR